MNEQDFVCWLALTDWEIHRYLPNNRLFSLLNDSHCSLNKMYLADCLLLPVCHSVNFMMVTIPWKAGSCNQLGFFSAGITGVTTVWHDFYFNLPDSDHLDGLLSYSEKVYRVFVKEIWQELLNYFNWKLSYFGSVFLLFIADNWLCITPLSLIHSNEYDLNI